MSLLMVEGSSKTSPFVTVAGTEGGNMSTTETPEAPPTEPGRPFLLTGEGWPYLLVPLIPVAIVLEFLHADAVAVFAASALGVIPTAALMGRATEELAARSGPGIGGLLNVTFGNAPELIIALFALGAGLHEVVKASLVGSILGNILLVLGVSMLVGGRKRERQRFELRAATAQSLMLLLATVALVMPAIFQLVAGGGLPDPAAKAVAFNTDLQALSVGVAIVLLASYGAGLVFSLKTHAHLFNPSHDEEEHGGEPWSVRKSVLMLAGAGAAVGWMSEILVHSITEASAAIGLSPFFVGIIVVAVVGNAAEHWVAVYFASRDKMDISVNIAVGSGAQIALFVAPVLVLASFVIGPFPMALVFNGFELGAVFLAVIIANEVTQRGESTWYEGLQLLAIYVVLGLTFFFV
jgi:Ca2+:H+ antiporter